MKYPAIIPFAEGMLKMCNGQFPRKCNTCKRSFNSFKEFVENTSPIGKGPASMSDVDSAGFDPIGFMSYVNCKCGSTLVLKCEDMTGTMHQQFLAALKREAATHGVPVTDILIELRHYIRDRAQK